MGSAIILGLIESGKYQASEIMVYDLDLEKTKELGKAHGFQVAGAYEDFLDLDQALEHLILAIKPQYMDDLLQDFTALVGRNEDRKNIFKDSVIVSIAAGTSIASFEKYFPENPIIRVMPNTPCQIRKGISALAPNAKVSEDQKETAVEIFKTIGEAVVLDEKYINAVTAVSGSGPAYYFLMMEAMTEAGKKLGLKENIAKKLAVTTAYGASSLAYDSMKNAQGGPNLLRKNVTSPGGTTQAAIESFEAQGFRDMVARALKAASDRGYELDN